MSFVRPSLMIVGFVLATVISYALLYLLNIMAKPMLLQFSHALFVADGQVEWE